MSVKGIARRNGALRGMLPMRRCGSWAGQIALPVSELRARPQPVLIDTTPIEDRLCKLQPLEFEPLRRTAQQPLFDSLIEEHHYLGYERRWESTRSFWSGLRAGR
jgi:hypothetical protein